jgi:cyclopropane fatty-acyl-phospholipid synthase-like methyltransferase
MKTDLSSLLTEVALYYSDKFTQHGETPQGVDWNGEESQILRFEQLCKVITSPERFSLYDWGCGYGALFSYLNRKHKEFSYLGLDVSESMINAAAKRHRNSSQASFLVANEPGNTFDYGIASGIFNVRLECSDAVWQKYIETTLDMMDKTCRFGFAFNCLTTYSDSKKKRDYLYYADPCVFFDICKLHYSKHVALLHDYGLYEFTILIRKQP